MKGRITAEPTVSPRFMTQADDEEGGRVVRQQKNIFKSVSNRSLVRHTGKSNRHSQDSTHNRHHSQSVFVMMETDKENQQPNCESNLLESRSISQIDNFRKERFRKLYGESKCEKSEKSEKRSEYQPMNAQFRLLQDRQATIREQQHTIRRLEMQLHQKDRLLVQLQKNIQGKESHIATLASSSISLNSAMELLKHQISHLTQTNLTIQGELSKYRSEAANKTQELTKLQHQLAEKMTELSTFSGLELRLKQLQELQDGLIGQAASLRHQNTKLSKFIGAARAHLPTSQPSCHICSTLFKSLRSLYE